MLVTLKGASVPALADNPEAQHLLNDYSVMLTALSMLQLDNLSSQGKQVSVLKKTTHFSSADSRPSAGPGVVRHGCLCNRDGSGQYPLPNG